MRPLGVVPAAPERHLLREGGTSERNEHETPRALGLEGAYEAFDDSDASVLSDGSESVLDLPTPAPALESLRGELSPLVRDQVAGTGAGVANSAIEI